MRKKAIYVIFIILTLIFLFTGGGPVLAMGWLPDPPDTPTDPSPPTAPEPMCISFIAMAASGAGGYYLGRLKKKKKKK